MTDRGVPSRFASDLPPSEELFARIRDAVASTPAAKTGPRPRVAAALAVVPLAIAAALWAASVVYARSPIRLDAIAHLTVELSFVVLLAIGLALAATLVAVDRGERGLGAGFGSLLSAAWLVAPIYAALALLGTTVAHDGPSAAMPHVSPFGLRCLSVAGVVGLVALASFAAALRRSAPVARSLRGAAVGAAAGAWAGVAVLVFCPASEVLHLAVGHVMPIAALTLVGLAVVPRALRP